MLHRIRVLCLVIVALLISGFFIFPSGTAQAETVFDGPATVSCESGGGVGNTPGPGRAGRWTPEPETPETENPGTEPEVEVPSWRPPNTGGGGNNHVNKPKAHNGPPMYHHKPTGPQGPQHPQRPQGPQGPQRPQNPHRPKGCNCNR